MCGSGSATVSCCIKPREPRFPRFRGGAERDVVGRWIHGEGEREIRRRESATSPLGPLDEPQAPRPRPLAQSQRLELGRIAKTVEIDVEDRQTAEIVELEERIGRAPDRFGDTELPKEATRECGLAGTELAREIDHHELTGTRTQARELLPERLGLLGRVGPDVHEAARD